MNKKDNSRVNSNSDRITDIETSQGSFERWFSWQVGVSFTVGCAVAGFLMFIMNQTFPLTTQIALINQDVNNIKNNDITHIELEINTINTTISAIQAGQSDQDKQLTEILTILKQK